MSLSMSPIVSLDNYLPSNKKDIEGFCGRWILKHKPLVTEPATGTTFPPFSHHLPYFVQRTDRINSLSIDQKTSNKCKFLSEPDLNSEYQSESLEEEDNDHDEDYLFEFDIGSPASSEESLHSDFEEHTILNVIEQEEKIMKKGGSISSDADTSSSNCSHRKESGVVVDGFSSVFGSTSSGVGSDRRLGHSNCDTEPVELEGISVRPEDWNSALYLGGKLPTPTSSSPGQVKTPEGVSTPILAASPQVQAESPLVSPDSVIGEDILCDCSWNSHNPREEQSSSNGDGGDNLENVNERPEDSDNNNDNNDMDERIESENEVETNKLAVQNSQPNSDDIIERISAKLNTPPSPPEKVKINSSLVVSTEKLCNLLHKLESDKVYSSHEDDSLEEDDILLSPVPSRQESIDERPKLRKCSSLKTSRSPPVTPGHRKIVRFADILGLDLSEVKTFVDEIPKVPKAAFADLDVSLSDLEVGSPVVSRSMFSSMTSNKHKTSSDSTISLMPMFNQPGGSTTFLETVSKQKICLENAFMEGPSTVFGIVRVLNISFHKAVTVRWTMDNWRTIMETDGEYIPGSSQANTDKFSFKLSTLANLEVGDRLQFCLRYECNGEFWDSNGGTNYIFQVFTNSSPSCSSSTRPVPAPVPIVNRNTSKSFRSSAQAYSPSLGDDPWLRFM